MAIENWLPTLEEKIKEIEGVVGVRSAWRQNGNDPGLPGTIQEFPFAIILPVAGQLEYSQGGPNHEFTNVQISFYTAQGLLPEAMDIAVPYIQKVRDKLAQNLSLDSTVSHILPSDGNWFEGPGAADYGGKSYTTINFFYTVKENIASDGNFSVAA